ncbi:MAG: ROK family protein [Pirellulales bacterium]
MARDRNHWVGFDLGGTKMCAVVFNDRFEPLGREKKKTKGHEGARVGMDRVIGVIRSALEQAKVAPDQLAGIGIGCPGAVDLDRGVIEDFANLAWKDVRVREKLNAEFGCPVVVLNDVDAGVYGEFRFGAARDARCALGVFPGTGIGGGCVYEGRLIRGKKYSAMEIGHVQVRPHGGRLCGCGRYGCLETEASRLAIASEAAQAAFRGDAPHLLALAGTDISSIRSGAIAESIKQGDSAVELIVRRAASLIGVAVGSACNFLAPDVVVMGGGLVEALPKWFIDIIDATAREHALPMFTKGLKVVAARLGDDANVLGAAAWAEALIATQSVEASTHGK